MSSSYAEIQCLGGSSEWSLILMFSLKHTFAVISTTTSSVISNMYMHIAHCSSCFNYCESLWYLSPLRMWAVWCWQIEILFWTMRIMGKGKGISVLAQVDMILWDFTWWWWCAYSALNIYMHVCLHACFLCAITSCEHNWKE